MSAEDESKVGAKAEAVAAADDDFSLLDTVDATALAAAYEETLKALTKQVTVALRARTRLTSIVASIRAKQQNSLSAQTSPLTDDELALLQQFGIAIERNGSADIVAQLDAIDISGIVVNADLIKCLTVRYNSIGRLLTRIIRDAKLRMERQMPIMLAQEEAKRVAQQQEQDKQAAVLAEEEARREMQESSAGQVDVKREVQDAAKNGEAIVLDDDDDDDVPLAGGVKQADKAEAGGQAVGQAIDLTSPSATVAKPAENADMPTNPAALLASLGVSGGALTEALAAVAQSGTGGGITAADGSDQAMNLDTFDFDSFGLSSLGGGEGGGSAPATSAGMAGLASVNFDNLTSGVSASGDGDLFGDGLLNFNTDQMDGMDLSFLSKLDGGGGGTNEDGNLLGNIDFSALLGNGTGN